MSQNTLTLLTVAAEMRAVGHSWESIARKVHRKPRTCQAWINRFRNDWTRLYREAQIKRFHETSEEAHSLLKSLMRDDDKKVRFSAIQLWVKSGAAAYGLTGGMRWGGAPSLDDGTAAFWASDLQDMERFRQDYDRKRKKQGLPPCTHEEFMAEHERKIEEACDAAEEVEAMNREQFEAEVMRKYTPSSPVVVAGLAVLLFVVGFLLRDLPSREASSVEGARAARVGG